MYDATEPLSPPPRPVPRHARRPVSASPKRSKPAGSTRTTSPGRPGRLFVKSTPSSPSAKSMEENRRARPIHRETGSGRRARVLVPIAVWGVAPGKDSHLVNEPVGVPAKKEVREMELPRSPQVSGSVSVRSLPARNRKAGRMRSDMVEESPSNGTPRVRADASTSAPPAMHPWATRRRAPRNTPAARARSFAPETTRSVPHPAPASASVGSTNARVSHITASSADTSSVASGVRHVDVAAEFGGDSGPSKVRYREHDFFNFLRRRKGSSGRHGR